MNETLKKITKSLLDRFGYRVVRHDRPVKIKTSTPPPYATLKVFKKKNKTLLFNANIKEGRGTPLWSLATPSYHPFVIAGRAWLTNEGSEKYKASIVREILNQYYVLVAPKDVSQLFDIYSHRQELCSLPVFSAVMPWWSSDPYGRMSKVEETTMRENERSGRRIGIEFGWPWVGPARAEKVSIEADRLIHVMESISRFGYKRHNGLEGDMQVDVLVNADGGWVWQVKSGQHRACALAALGFGTIPIRCGQIIHRNAVTIWPNVQRGIYSIEEALNIFDNSFSGALPAFASGWISFVDELGL